jgi:polar amino acid transport system permease protein
MQGAAPSAPVMDGQLDRPQPIKAIPIRHWGRWASATVLLFLAFALAWSLAHNANVGWATIGEYLFKPLTLRGVVVTIEMTVIAMVMGIVGGTIVAVMRLSENPVLRVVSWFYVWLFRGVPLLVQIIFWGFLGALYPTLFLGIPFVGVVFAQGSTSALIGAFTAAILALGLNEVAYAAELVRAGIISVDHGQREAASSLGMSNRLMMRRVVLPQAMRVIIPPMGNETITMLKMTSLVSVISGRDLLTTVQQVYSQNFEQIPLLIVASIWYLTLTTVLSIGQYYLEKRFGRGFGQVDVARAERKALKREAADNA